MSAQDDIDRFAAQSDLCRLVADIDRVFAAVGVSHLVDRDGHELALDAALDEIKDMREKLIDAQRENGPVESSLWTTPSQPNMPLPEATPVAPCVVCGAPRMAGAMGWQDMLCNDCAGHPRAKELYDRATASEKAERERDDLRARLDAAEHRAGRAERDRTDLKSALDAIAAALHPNWPKEYTNGYVAQQLPGMVEDVTRERYEYASYSRHLGSRIDALESELARMRPVVEAALAVREVHNLKDLDEYEKDWVKYGFGRSEEDRNLLRAVDQLRASRDVGGRKEGFGFGHEKEHDAAAKHGRRCPVCARLAGKEKDDA